MGQSCSGGGLCGSAALSGYSWNCRGASAHSAGPALPLCHAGPTAQVHSHQGITVRLCTALTEMFTPVCVCVCVAGLCLYRSLSRAAVVFCHWMLLEIHLFEVFSSSCFAASQAQVQALRLKHRELQLRCCDTLSFLFFR